MELISFKGTIKRLSYTHAAMDTLEIVNEFSLTAALLESKLYNALKLKWQPTREKTNAFTCVSLIVSHAEPPS